MLTYFARTVEAESPTVPIGDDSSSSYAATEQLLSPSHAPVTSNKRKYNRTLTVQDNFAMQIKAATGLDLLKADDRNGRAVSQCGNCRAAGHLTYLRNVTKNWVTHSNKCPGLHKKLLSAQPAEAEAFVMHVTLVIYNSLAKCNINIMSIMSLQSVVV